jgi:hypothetical protein
MAVRLLALRTRRTLLPRNIIILMFLVLILLEAAKLKSEDFSQVSYFTTFDRSVYVTVA